MAMAMKGGGDNFGWLMQYFFNFRKKYSEDDAMGWWMRMILHAFGLILILTFFLTQVFLKKVVHSGRRRRLPPGPSNLPIVGAFLSVGFRKRHLTFLELAKKHGPLLYMKLGGGDVVVANDAETARLVLQIHDAEFSGREDQLQPEEMEKVYGSASLSILVCSYNARYRLTRKVLNFELLCQKKINEMSSLRRQELHFLVGAVDAHSTGGGNSFKIRPLVNDRTIALMYRMVLGRLYPRSDKIAATVEEMKVGLSDYKDFAEKMNIGEVIPQLGWLDLQKITAGLKKAGDVFEHISSVIVDEHRKNPATESEAKNFVDFLMEYDEGGDTFSDNAIKAILHDIILGAIDPVVLTVEWSLAQLLRHPLTLLKAQREIDAIVGDCSPLEDSDLRNLPYIGAIVKETLRLHPVNFFTGAHVNEREVAVAGFSIPALTRVYVNLYGVGRDPKYWDKADDFLPERFLGENSGINMSGSHFQLLPFSSGRHRCPAFLLSSVLVPHMLAILLHAFEWRLPGSMRPEHIVMEARGLNDFNEMLHPLTVCAISRSAAQNYNQIK